MLILKIGIAFAILLSIEIYARKCDKKNSQKQLRKSIPNQKSEIKPKSAATAQPKNEIKPKRAVEPKEGTLFQKSNNGFDLYIFEKTPGIEEIRQNVLNGSVKYGYYKEDNVIVMLFKFGNSEWFDYPYSIHSLSDKTTKIEEITGNKGFTVNVSLVNVDSGYKLDSKRVFEMDTKASKMLRGDIIKQKEMGFDKVIFNKNVDEIYDKYSKLMLVSMARFIEDSNNRLEKKSNLI